MKQLGACLVLVLLWFAGPDLAQTAPPSESPVSGRGPVWANGHEVNGEPRFTVLDSVLYYLDTYRYYPLHDRKMHVRPKPAAIARFNIMEEARTAADQGSQTPLDWARRYLQILWAHPEIVDSCSVTDCSIEIKFVGTPILHAIEIPQRFPIERPRLATRDDAIRSKQDEFLDAYNAGAWILFGGEPGHAYYTFVPRGMQVQFITLVDAVRELADGGLAGDALAEAVSRLDVGDTPLGHEDFVRDLLRACEEGR